MSLPLIRRFAPPSPRLRGEGVHPHGALILTTPARFFWYELVTTDIEAARDFYASVVGWGVQDAGLPGTPYTHFTVGDEPVCGLTELRQDARGMGAVPQWIGYLGVANIDAAVARIGQFGGTVHVRPVDGPNRFSLVADPQMATLALVEVPMQERPPPLMARVDGRVGWHELLAGDGDTAFAFYGAVFGWTKSVLETVDIGTYQQFAIGRETVGGMFTKPSWLPHPFWLFYFRIAGPGAAARRVEAGGGTILYGPVELPGGSRILHCADPQGAVFGLTLRAGRKAVGYSFGAARSKGEQGVPSPRLRGEGTHSSS